MRRLVFFGFLLLCAVGSKAQTETPLGNNALVFSGISELSKSSYVQFPTGSFETAATTVEMWMRTTGSGSNRTLYSAKTSSGNTRMSLHVSSEGRAGIWNGQGWQYINTPIAYDTWMHVAFVITNSSTTVFTNGVQRGVIPLGMRTTVTSTIPRIGVNGDFTSTESWRGGIDEIRIWGEARNAAQVLSDMNDNVTTTATNLLAYYDCNQGTPNGDNKYITTLTDRSSAQKNGTLMNFKRGPFSYSNFIAYSPAPLIPPYTGSQLFVNGAVAEGGDGSSWQSPFTSLADALEVVNTASQNVNIYVAKGTYTPSEDRSSTFAITRDGISLYGGFVGNETNLATRDPRYNETILSGEIGEQYFPYDNSTHVLAIVARGSVITAATKVDGFTISNGYASGGNALVNQKSLDGRSGAAILIDGRNSGTGCSPIITNCVIANNYAEGYATDSEDPPVMGYGGAIRVDATDGGVANPQFSNCVFTGNNADLTSGIVMGVLCSNSQSNVTVSNCIFTRNSGGSELIHHDATFGSSVLTFNNNTVFDNKTVEFIHTYTRGFQGSLHFTNNIILYGASRLVDDETLYGSTIENFVLANNVIEFANSENGNIETNNFDFFRNPFDAIGPDGIWRTADDGFNLKGCGVTLNSGDNSVATTTDIKGAPRVNQTTIDRGAYEGVPTAIVLSTTAANDVPFVAEGCEGEPFTPYAIPGQPGNLSIAIAWGANNNIARLSAEVTINTEVSNFVETNRNIGTAAMGRYWNVNLNGAPLFDPVTLRFYYNAADTIDMKSMLDGIGATSEVRWVKTNGTPYSPYFITPETINDPGFTWLVPSARGVENGIAYVEFNNITSFSGGGAVVVAEGALPIRITDFKAKAKDCSVQLDWSVADAVNFKGYEVERSANGIAYTQVGKLAHVSTKTAYSFADASISGSGKYYYRLKLVDIDGQFVYSDVLAVESICSAGLNNIVIAPNPVRSELTIQFNGDAKNALVNIRSIQGTLISSTKIVNSANTIKIPVSSLKAGVYFVELRTSSGKAITQKIIKQ